MSRSVPEWIGKTDDAAVPPRVRARIFLRDDGVCHLSGRKIRPGEKWELEHVVALCNGGEHRESNMAPALVEPHKIKTAADRRVKAKDDRVRKRHLGIKKPRTIRAWRKMNGDPVYASRER
jgi:5-methylcytosine-specific restriction endonuclease McrA